MSSEYVVSRLISDNGISAIGNRLNEAAGLPFKADYRYFNGQLHLQGGGFLGYQVNVISDAQAQATTEIWHTTHDQFPFHGLPNSTRVYRWGQYRFYKPAKETYVIYKHAGHLPTGQYGVRGDVNSTAYKANTPTARTWLNCSGSMSSVGGRLRRTLPESTLEMTYEPGVYYEPGVSGAPTAPSSARKTVNTYDNCGNATSIVMSHVVPTGTWEAEWDAPSTGESVTTTNIFQNVIDTNRWHIGRLLRSTTTSVKP